MRIKNTLAICIAFLSNIAGCAGTDDSGRSAPGSGLYDGEEKEARAIFLLIMQEGCRCGRESIKNGKGADAVEQCYTSYIEQYRGRLRALALDPDSAAGKACLEQVAAADDCIMSLWRDAREADRAGKLFFKGTVVSQKRLSKTEVEIVMAESATGKEKTFRSGRFPDNPAKFTPNISSYEMEIEYEILKSPRTGRRYYRIKDNAHSLP